VVGDDLADAFRRGVADLTQAVDWALGGKRLSKEDRWMHLSSHAQEITCPA
jgi:hypothetical protein